MANREYKVAVQGKTALRATGYATFGRCLLMPIFAMVSLLVGQVSAHETNAALSHTAIEQIDLSKRSGVQEMVVSVKFMDDAIRKYQSFADYELLYRGIAPKAQAIHWGVAEDMVVEHAVLRAPGLDKGFLRLVKFHGAKQVRIRSSARPFDTGGIFNLNMRAKNMDEAFEEMRDHGFVGFADPTYYMFRGKGYGGAMLRGHDGVVINLLTRVSGDYSDAPPFKRLSQVMNSTQMVGDFESYEANKKFYSEKLGWVLRFEGEPDWPEDGSNNMSLPNSIVLTGNVGQKAAGFSFSMEADGGTIEIFSFDGISGIDYSDRGAPPNLGVLMYRVHVPDLDAYAKKITANGVEILRPTMTMQAAPYGKIDAFVVKSPTGAWIEFFQQK